MEVSSATPDAPIEPAQAGTPAAPAAEPVAPPAPEPAPDQSTTEADQRLAQAEFTKATQAFSIIRQELGLEGKPSRDQIIAAVKALKERQAGDEPADQPTEREQELEQRAFAAELRVQEAIYSPIYGTGFTDRALELVNTARQTNDPEKLMEAVVTFLESAKPASPSTPAAPATEPTTPVPPPDAGLPEGDQPPSGRPVPAAGRRESGVVSTVRGLFADAATKAASR